LKWWTLANGAIMQPIGRIENAVWHDSISWNELSL
jgi:hypothetical protein